MIPELKAGDIVVILKTLEPNLINSPVEGGLGILYPQNFHYMKPDGEMRYALKVDNSYGYWMADASEIEKIGEL